MSLTGTLIVITGPTGSGKTAIAIKLAQALQCHILSADSRQIYRDMPIGTAAPTADQLSAAPHHFVGTLPLDAYYSAAQFEADVLSLLPTLWQQSPYAILCGGSVMYIDAVVRGIDAMPTITPQVRQRVIDLHEQLGREGLLALLEISDPDYYHKADLANTRRVMHALEVTLQAGQPYSSLCTGARAQRPFAIRQYAIDVPRDTLFSRINARVADMVEAGLVDEARRLLPYRHLNALNTVGYKELFAYFDGIMDYDTAIARIAKNTRVYAKKQLTMLAKERPELRRVSPDTALSTILADLAAER